MLFKILQPGWSAIFIEAPNIQEVRKMIKLSQQSEIRMFERTYPAWAEHLKKLYKYPTIVEKESK